MRDRQREHRHERRGDRRRVRRREGDGRRPRIGLGRVEELHAPRDEHDQLQPRIAARAGREVRRVSAARRSARRPRVRESAAADRAQRVAVAHDEQRVEPVAFGVRASRLRAEHHQRGGVRVRVGAGRRDDRDRGDVAAQRRAGARVHRMREAFAAEVGPMPVIAGGRDGRVDEIDRAHRAAPVVVGRFERDRPRRAVRLASARAQLAVDADEPCADVVAIEHARKLVHAEALRDPAQVEGDVREPARPAPRDIDFEQFVDRAARRRHGAAQDRRAAARVDRARQPVRGVGRARRLAVRRAPVLRLSVRRVSVRRVSINRTSINRVSAGRLSIRRPFVVRLSVRGRARPESPSIDERADADVERVVRLAADFPRAHEHRGEVRADRRPASGRRAIEPRQIRIGLPVRHLRVDRPHRRVEGGRDRPRVGRRRRVELRAVARAHRRAACAAAIQPRAGRPFNRRLRHSAPAASIARRTSRNPPGCAPTRARRRRPSRGRRTP
ncbi:hypothetical protein X941_5758 [Burkholderia pseudomallei MSHR5569]|nr:hypothetical protein X941_5758 [Burkholderia pseudomallei MSHR5569]